MTSIYTYNLSTLPNSAQVATTDYVTLNGLVSSAVGTFPRNQYNNCWTPVYAAISQSGTTSFPASYGGICVNTSGSINISLPLSNNFLLKSAPFIFTAAHSNNFAVSFTPPSTGVTYTAFGIAFSTGATYGLFCGQYHSILMVVNNLILYPLLHRIKYKTFTTRPGQSTIAGSVHAPSSASATSSLVLNKLYIIPYFMNKYYLGVTTVACSFEVTTIGTASNVTKVGFWITPNLGNGCQTNTTNGNYPFLAMDTTAVSTTTTGTKNISVSFSGYMGPVYIGIVSQTGTACVVRGLGTKRWNAQIPRIGTISSSTDYTYFTSTDSITGAIPASLTSVTPANAITSPGIMIS